MSRHSVVVFTAALNYLNRGTGRVKRKTYHGILICLWCATHSVSGVSERPSVNDFSWLAGCREGGFVPAWCGRNNGQNRPVAQC